MQCSIIFLNGDIFGHVLGLNIFIQSVESTELVKKIEKCQYNDSGKRSIHKFLHKSTRATIQNAAKQSTSHRSCHRHYHYHHHKY